MTSYTILRDISFLWSMIHVVAFFLLLFKPRYSWRITWTVGFAGTSALLVFNVLAMYWLGHGIIMSIAFFSCTLPSLLLFFVLSQYRDGRFFFLFCLSDTSCFWILQLTNFLDRLAGDTYVVMLISRVILFPLAELCIWRFFQKPFLFLQERVDKGWWLFTAIGGVYYLLIMVTSVPVGAPLPDMAGMIRILLVMVLMPLTYLTILHSLWRQIQISESRQQIALQRREYKAICQKVELGKLYRHDTRHHLVVLEGLLQQNDTQEALRYIRTLSGRLEGLRQRIWCANPAVNAVLSAYVDQAEESGCTVRGEVLLPEKFPYGEMDVCLMVGNALENAVQACLRNPPEARRIRLKLELTENRRLILCVGNSCPEPVKLGPDGFPIVQSEGEHGLGLRSIRSVAESHGGLIRCQWEDGKFFLWAVLFPQE